MNYVIENNVPMPNVRGKSEPTTTSLLKSLEVGQSILIDKTPAQMASLATAVRRVTGMTFATRKADKGCRVWRTA